MSEDPFGVLGLPATPDLTDDDVRAAWRRIAAATHPDRADGGDPTRFALAAAAYTDLRTRYGRGEAYADLLAGQRQRRPRAQARPSQADTTPSLANSAAGAAHLARNATAPASERVGAAAAGRGPRGARSLAFRVRVGRPGVLVLRLAIAAAISAVGFVVTGAQPAAFALATGAVTWFLLTVRHDLAR
jgi:curved DNA-binding protein CbpA